MPMGLSEFAPAPVNNSPHGRGIRSMLMILPPSTGIPRVMSAMGESRIVVTIQRYARARTDAMPAKSHASAATFNAPPIVRS